jgi:MFS family permease
MGLATASAIAGRTLAGWVLGGSIDRRLVACASYAVQIAGCIVFVVAAGSSPALLLLAVVLFGAGIGNATSLPPLIAQTEFVEDDVGRVVAIIVAVAQGTYAFAPAVFGLIRDLAPQTGDATPALFIVAAAVQGGAIVALLAGRRR